MQLTAINSHALPGHSRRKPRFNIVVVYEDFVTATRAMAVYDSLVRSLGDHYEFSNSAWKFEILRQASLKQIAAYDALESDVILISAHAESDLPSEVKSWIDLWWEQGANGVL